MSAPANFKLDHRAVEWESTRPWSGAIIAPRANLHSSCASLLLDGEWKFRYSARPGGLDFTKETYNDGSWNTIPVPSHWVLQGRGKPIYTNLEYPFVVDPPHVPTENPTGDYRCCFTLPWEDTVGSQTILRFDGAESFLKVWVNGKEIGWSTGSRLRVEFDITSAVHRGLNVLCARVLQWSAATYLEDQDQWWLPGIFRSVTVLHRPPLAIRDVFVHASYDHTKQLGTLRVDVDPHATIEIPELNLHLQAGEKVTLPVEPWSAEIPRLYNAEIRTPDDTVGIKIGFRTVAMVDGRLTVNGVPLLLNGVNRHEFHCERGRALDEATMLQDVIMMKQHNINAVRTSHYPPHSRFLELCDEYGLWVIDEGDLETHGFGYCMLRNNPTDSPDWSEAMLNRTQRLVERDKNHPSVIIWSLGNESDRGVNIGLMAKWVSQRDPSRAVLYENDWTAEYSDIWCHMYTWHAEVERIGRGEETFDGYGYHKGRAAELDPEERDRLAKARAKKPFLLIEYGHAQGNGPGGLEEYQDLFEKYPRLLGGFIWEWIDHGLKRTNEDWYTYGGDFGEEVHSANSCCDGLLFPNRQPSPGLLQVKRIFEPVKICFDGGRLTIRNRRAFANTSDLAYKWIMELDGRMIDNGDLKVTVVQPGSSVTIDVPTVTSKGELWCTVSAILRADAPWAKKGHEVAWAQARIETDDSPNASATIAPRIHRNIVRVGPAEFDATYGNMLSLGGIGISKAHLNIWRAPTDNDRGNELHSEWPKVMTNYESKWRQAGLHRMQHRVDSVELGQCLEVQETVGAAIFDRQLRVVYRYEAKDDSCIAVNITVRAIGDWGDLPLPRLGMLFVVQDRSQRVKWYGCGPGEAYPDSRKAVRVGLFERSVEDMQTPYVFPQENGSRIDTRWAELTFNERVLHISGKPLFAFSVRRWSDEALDLAKHTTDLQESQETFLNIDYAQSGLGSASCGPGVLDQYRINLSDRETISFGFTLQCQ